MPSAEIVAGSSNHSDEQTKRPGSIGEQHGKLKLLGNLGGGRGTLGPKCDAKKEQGGVNLG